MKQTKQFNQNVTMVLFLLPSILAFGIFVYYVFGFSLYLSTTSWNFVSAKKNFIALTNYGKILQDEMFFKVLKNTFVFAIGNVFLSIGFGLVVALLMNGKLKGKGILRTVFYIPNVTTTSAVAILWIWIFDPSFGLVNYLLGLFGIAGPNWLMDPRYAMWVVISLSVWRSIGYNMVIFLGGLSSIPSSLYEAAEIDGGSKMKQFIHITFPMLSSTTYFLVMTSIISSLQVFDAVQVMTQGGPVSSTRVMNIYIYDKAFVQFKAGYASALSVVFFLIILVMTIGQNVASKKWVYYEN